MERMREQVKKVEERALQADELEKKVEDMDILLEELELKE